jgi:hypothetical protein
MSDKFEAFDKIPRLNKTMWITEKIDGTNAQVLVCEDGSVLAGSRNRWITPDADNFGFAAWVKKHEDELREGLGVGRHYGEWWGKGIQRGYGLDEKRFSLFNVGRWQSYDETDTPPDCCHVVPLLFVGEFDSLEAYWQAAGLRLRGSRAAPGFMEPEGVMVYHEAARQYFKLPFDPAPKGR